MSSLPPSQPNQNNKGFPLLGMFWGLVFSVAGILLAGWLFSRAIARPDLTENFPTPTLIILTSPPTIAPTETPLKATPTTQPTATPEPTKDFTIAQDVLTAGYFGVVTNVDEGVGVRMRPAPVVGNIPIAEILGGTAVFLLTGPEEGSGLLWWEIELPDGRTGWMAEQFLASAIKPADWESNPNAQAIIPTATPFIGPTPTPQLTVGGFGVVANGGGIGIRFRPEPNVNNEPIQEVFDGTFGKVLDGPTTGSGLQWWQIELEDGTAGWIAAQYFVVSGEPADWGQ